MSTPSPIGGLYLRAQKTGRTVVAECGCEVTVHWFSTKSHSAKFDPCATHIERKRKRS